MSGKRLDVEELGFDMPTSINDEIPTYPAAVTCHTEGCVNNDISINMWVAITNSSVQCGPCGEEITDIVPA